jgi:alpha-D-xyloside xylohydrolase
MELIAPGIWRIRLGTPEAATPVALREEPPALDGLRDLPKVDAPPFQVEAVSLQTSPRGCVIELPMREGEEIYGFGLQFHSHKQTGLKKTIRVNADPVADTGDSHAPVPFYVSTKGYGVFVDTARYAGFYCGSHVKRDATTDSPAAPRPMVIDIPSAQGADIYVFAGPTMKNAVQRYNLFSGGGCLPPLWGLGVWYRLHHQYTADEAILFAKTFRERMMPIDVFGLEPGWQTHAYPSSYAWSPERFPDPDGFVSRMSEMGYKVNLWEQVFVDPSSPLYDTMRPHAGNYEVWGGIAPDMTISKARQAFCDYHEDTFIRPGVSGFKVDECDNSDFNRDPWSFPEHSRFPSGVDGEQMHSSIGLLYQKAHLSVFRRNNVRTYCSVRSSHALAAPYPFVLYSDLYNHRDFVRALVNSGFGGLLWSPEVRRCASVEDLLRRLQVVALSPQALINAWNMKLPPWWQPDGAKNDAGEALDNLAEVEAMCREVFRLRMSLLPYLYSAFARYHFEGVPPVRAVVLDYPDDPNTYELDSQYLLGDALLVAPIFAGQTGRTVYLPPGNWYCFWTHQRYEGGKSYDVQLDVQHIPLYIKEGSILPLAQSVEYVARDLRFDLTVYTFGGACAPFRLFEDDGLSFEYEKGACNWVELTWSPDQGPGITREGSYPHQRYDVVDWKHVGSRAS